LREKLHLDAKRIARDDFLAGIKGLAARHLRPGKRVPNTKEAAMDVNFSTPSIMSP